MRDIFRKRKKLKEKKPGKPPKKMEYFSLFFLYLMRSCFVSVRRRRAVAHSSVITEKLINTNLNSKPFSINFL